MPSTGLTNGKKVTVSVTGFPANAGLVAIECAPPANAQDLCNTSGIRFITANKHGAGSVKFTVTTGQQGTVASSVCPPTTGDCVITVADVASQNYSATDPIVFASQTTTTTSTTLAGTTTTVASGVTTTSVVTGGGTTSIVTSASTTAVVSGVTTTSVVTGGGTTSIVTSGSGASRSDPGLANTGTPSDTLFVAGIALLLIGAGTVATIASRRKRAPASPT